MTRLLVHVEGPTEETFVNEVLRPHLYASGFTSVGARILGNARLREHRGGIRPWVDVRDEVVRHLKQDSGSYATTFVDYYGMPAQGASAWPGRAAAIQIPFEERAPRVEAEMRADLLAELGEDGGRVRFVPFVAMHEFEALLFSDCAAFARGVGMAQLEPRLQAIRAQFASPEEINDSPITAPSKRIVGLMPGYEKPLFGTLAALEVGLASIRASCPHFNSWLTALEEIPGESH